MCVCLSVCVCEQFINACEIDYSIIMKYKVDPKCQLASRHFGYAWESGGQKYSKRFQSKVRGVTNYSYSSQYHHSVLGCTISLKHSWYTSTCCCIDNFCAPLMVEWNHQQLVQVIWIEVASSLGSYISSWPNTFPTVLVYNKNNRVYRECTVHVLHKLAIFMFD